MNHAKKDRPEACAGPCERCELGRGLEHDSGPAAWSGGRLVFASTAVFLLPLAGAIAGAALVRTAPLRQLAAALAGFAVGVAGAAGLTRLVRPRAKANS